MAKDIREKICLGVDSRFIRQSIKLALIAMKKTFNAIFRNPVEFQICAIYISDMLALL